MLFGMIRVGLLEHRRFGWLRRDAFRGRVFCDRPQSSFSTAPMNPGPSFTVSVCLAALNFELDGTAAGSFVAAAIKERDPIRDRLAVIAREHVIGAEAEP